MFVSRGSILPKNLDTTILNLFVLTSTKGLYYIRNTSTFIIKQEHLQRVGILLFDASCAL